MLCKIFADCKPSISYRLTHCCIISTYSPVLSCVWQIKVDDSGKIVDARFKTFGCGSAIASSSLATEWVKGRSVSTHGLVVLPWCACVFSTASICIMKLAGLVEYVHAKNCTLNGLPCSVLRLPSFSYILTKSPVWWCQCKFIQKTWCSHYWHFISPFSCGIVAE